MSKNKWQALSMKDRAFLIREAVRNGITDINSIRDTWEHRFDGTKDNIPTEDEYITQRTGERIQQAQDKAYNRTDTIIPVFGEKTEADKKRQAEELKSAQGLYNLYKTYKQKMDRGEMLAVDFGFGYLDKQGIQKALSEADAKLMHATYMHNADKLIGPGCVATSMDNYDKDCISNKEFAKNPGKYGFKKIDNRDIKPGDILQFARNHMLMANTSSTNSDGSLTNPLNMRYSGSNGYDAVRKGSRYPAKWEDIEAYRFVGDKADSLQWKKEYRERYGHQFSGKKDHPEHGVQYELKKESIYTSDLNNPFKKFSTAEDAPPTLPKQDLHFEWLRPVDDAIAQGSGFLYDPLFYKKNKILRDKIYNTFYSLDDPDSDINIPEEYEILDREQVRKLLPKRDYIGGKTPKETRDKVASLIPGLVDSLQSISSRHKINPELLHHRISKEGYYDKKASKYNYEIYKDEMPEYWNNVANQEVNGFSELGLDDAGELLEKGLIKVTRPISYETIDATNEKGRNVTSVITPNLWDALEIKAGDIKYRQEEMRKRGVPAEDLDTWTNAAYNLGLYHEDLNNEAWIRKNYTLPSYKNLFKK